MLVEPIYTGHYSYSVDAQRRLAIPKDWRAAGTDVVQYWLMPGDDGTIHVLGRDLFFKQFVEPLRANVNLADFRSMSAMGDMGSSTTYAAPDRQGRITLTEEQLLLSGVTDKAVLVGAYFTFQICSPQLWETRRQGRDDSLKYVKNVLEPRSDFNVSG